MADGDDGKDRPSAAASGRRRYPPPDQASRAGRSPTEFNLPKINHEDDLTPELFDKICKYVYAATRINLGRNKIELVRARFGKVLRRRGMTGFREYFSWMQSDTTGEASREVMNAISTNLTSFFRENDHFSYLASSLLPEAARRGRPRSLGGRIRLRGWSAGCSTGEEAYSIAMTIDETLPSLDGWDIRLLATDIDTNVVAHGLDGVYDEERISGIKPALVKKYFTSSVGAKGKPVYTVREPLRKLITFRHMNLFSDWPFRSQFDFIFCRNVMIYFDRPTQEALVNRFYDVLAPGGSLFIGHSESLSGVNHQFEYVRPTIYLKK